EAGFEVWVHSRSSAPVESLVEHGARRAESLRALGGCGRVITMLPDGATTAALVLGDNGLASHVAPGTILIDMGTSGPPVAREIAERCRADGLRALDAPVSGGEEGAEAGALSIMVGGAAADVAAAQDLFAVLGSSVVHVGPSGAGQVMKAANQMLVGGIIAALSEALLLAERNGIDLAKARQVLAAGLAGNRVLALRGERMADRRFEAGARVALHHKDLLFALDEARNVALRAPVTAVVADLLAGLITAGGGELDHTAILEHLDGSSAVSTDERMTHG
ncbi:MAG: NAD(P)-dependent oxidoreductase, partial [Trueperaceae bacterium]